MTFSIGVSNLLIIEEWRSIPDFEGVYEISNLGRAKSLDRIAVSPSRGAQKLTGRILRSGRSSNGYPSVALCKDGKPSTHNIHALVAAAFIGPRPDGCDIDHIDGDKDNNVPENLRYVSTSINCRNTTKATSASGVVGVYRNGSGWAAQARWDGRQKHLGTFRTIEEARIARLKFEREVDYRGFTLAPR